MSGLDLSGLLIFAGALAVAAISPGPAIAALVVRVLSRGREGAVAFSAGLALGDVVWLSFAVLGLSLLAQTFHEVFLAIKYLGAAYLLFIAWKFWTAPARAPDLAAPVSRDRPTRLFVAGLTLAMGNPKTMVFYLALLPSILDLIKVDALAFAELTAVVAVVLAAVFGGYILLALRARKLITSARAARLVNRGSGAVMAGAAVAIATR
jgi:threonine/homoserine/homoserine lactone efflux protein